MTMRGAILSALAIMVAAALFQSGAPLATQAQSEPETITADNVTRLQQVGTIGRGNVRDTAYSADGTMLAVAGSMGVWLYDGSDMMATPTLLEGHSESIISIDYAPDGVLLATGSFDDTVRLWDTGSGEEIAIFAEHESDVRFVTFSPDGSRLATSSGFGSIIIYDVVAQRVEHVIDGHQSRVEVLAYSSDGSVLASGSADETVRLWSVEGTVELVGEINPGARVSALEFSPVDPLLTIGLTSFGSSSAVESFLSIWETENFTQFATLDVIEGTVWDLEYSIDGSLLAAHDGDELVRVFDTMTLTEIATLEGPPTVGAFGLSIAPDGSTLAQSVFGGGVIFDLSTQEIVATFPEHQIEIDTIAFAPDGASLFWMSSGGNRTVNQTRIDSLETSFVYESEELPTDFVLWPDGSRIATDFQSLFDGNGVHIIDVETGTQVAQFASEAIISSVAVSPDGGMLAIGSRDGIALWDVATTSALMVLDVASARVESIAFSPDGALLLAGDNNDVAHLWQLSDGQQIGTFTDQSDVVEAVQFSPDGAQFVVASRDGAVNVYDTATQQLLHTIEHEDGVTTIAFSPDGSLLAAGGWEATIFLYDTATWTELYQLTRHTSEINMIVFSPDGSLLASSGFDGAVRLWAVGAE